VSETPHVIDELQDRLDGRLDAQSRSRIEAHLASCAICQRAAEDLAAVKTALGRLPLAEGPADLDARVSAALAAESAPAPRRWPWAAAGALAAAAVVALWLWPEASLPQRASQQVARLESGALTLEKTTTSPAELERHFASRGLPVRVLDLGMMGLSLTGGAVVSLDGRPAGLYVYRRQDGARLVCQMLVGRLGELPPAQAVLAHKEFEFHVYRDGARTLVFWAEGQVLCVLISDLPEHEVIELAKAKAMMPPTT
jgi:anti-sigma factor RsiW